MASTLLIQLQRPNGSWVDVGLLNNDGSRNTFDFLSSYWEISDRPILGQIFEEHGKRWNPSTHVALPRWFSHLLPEGPMRLAVAQAAEIHPDREFELIRRLGLDDLPGAVRAQPVSSEGVIIAAAEQAEEYSGGDSDPLLKFSLAGAQLKYSLFSDGRGLTIPAKGTAGNVIAKLPDTRHGFDGVPEAEFAAMRLAASSGIDTASVRLARVGDIQGFEDWGLWVGNEPILVVDRFDRLANDIRIHMEEIAQVIDIPTRQNNSKYKHANYETVAMLVASFVGVDAVASVIDRLVFNILIGNGDAHLKNWAFLYEDGYNAALSPAYDIVPTILYMSADDMGLNLNGTKSFTSIDFQSFDGMGRRTDFGVSEARRQVRSAVERVLENWGALEELLPAHQFNRLTVRLKTLPLAGLV
ncbi:type II toxin-antitoxin system HipA family toxin [Mycobacteroides abscessus]|uniref:type II toxin-antitoxin system HipA family toxin n=1 Tax=Mycobacteroides abscessus TaxID=36809 RepID=UPI000940BF30|nr:type II toxin-antitoxin system HipA family toxin [Mycobacteroides abscessus]